jgi:site-specific recombinase XerD
VPSIASRRLAAFPKALTPGEVRKLLKASDRRTRNGRRDFVVLLLMVRLGLRAGEVANLRLDDVDWTRGEIVIRGKPCREDRLPLPEDVGQAIVSYLTRGRPPSTSRNLILRSRAPHREVTRSTVGGVVVRTSKRAGLASVNAHHLRHTAATQMLRGGASLTEIGQVLRHQHIDTTAIYAKVDLRRLRELSRAWPGGRL